MKKIKTVVTRHTGYLYGIDEEFKKEKFKKSKSEKGSISVFVIVAFIFCMTILITLYWKSSNYQISVLQSEQIIKDIYGEDVSKIDEVHGQFETGKLEEEFKDNTKVQYVINYPVDIDGDEDYTDDWEIFYIEDYKGEDGAFPGNQPTKGKRIFLIASDYAKILDDPESAIRKSMGKSYLLQSSQEKQKEYVVRWDYSIHINQNQYNCILPNQEEKANLFPKLFEESLYKIWEHKDITASRCTATLLCTDNWSDFKNDTYADYAVGGPSLAMWIHSWNMRHPDKMAYYNIGDDGYYIGMDENPTGSTTQILSGETDLLYYPHEPSQFGDFDGDGIEEECWGYWVASPCRIIWRAKCNESRMWDWFSG